MPGQVVLAVPQVRGQLALQGPLQDRGDQLAEHRPGPGQPQPPGRVLRPVQQRIQQPVIHQLPQRHPRRLHARGCQPGPLSPAPTTTPLLSVINVTVIPPFKAAPRPAISYPL